MNLKGHSPKRYSYMTASQNRRVCAVLTGFFISHLIRRQNGIPHMPERQEITVSRVCRDAHPKNTNMLMASMLAVAQEQKEQRRIDSSKSRRCRDSLIYVRDATLLNRLSVPQCKGLRMTHRMCRLRERLCSTLSHMAQHSEEAVNGDLPMRGG